VKNGVYNILTNDLYLSSYKGNISLSDKFKTNTFFRIRIISGFFNDTYYKIEQIESDNRLVYLKDKELIFDKTNTSLDLWNIHKISYDGYIIKNINGCYIITIKFHIFCNYIPETQASKFKLIKIYNEVNERDKNSIINREILNNEPIDILIKYIDLRDPDLKRKGIHQIAKDYDNEELRYSLRSILYNIPWIRKIFILMPNKKVRYLKNYTLINEKIIYVNDKDFLGYDSSNFNAFLFRYWKMKKFNISDNFIIMDDDYFIGKKLEKSDFFYVEKGKVVPSIVSSNFLKIEQKSVEENCETYEKKVKSNKEEQGGDEWNYSVSLTYSFILNIFNIPFGKSIFIPRFTHNAIPVNIKEIKEVYDLVYMSKYKFSTLDCLYRISGYLQFQILIMAFAFIKYSRKISPISNTFIQLNDSISANHDYCLFCINKGAGHFNYLNYYKSKITLEYIFPNPTSFEIIDYSFQKISFDATRSLDNNLKICEKQKSHLIQKDEFYFLQVLIILFFFLILMKEHYKYSE
jgi:hypothetical protein